MELLIVALVVVAVIAFGFAEIKAYDALLDEQVDAGTFQEWLGSREHRIARRFGGAIFTWLSHRVRSQ